MFLVGVLLLLTEPLRATGDGLDSSVAARYLGDCEEEYCGGNWGSECRNTSGEMANSNDSQDPVCFFV